MNFIACRYLFPFQRYFCSNSEVVLNSSKFWTFFAFQNFKGAVPPQKLYMHYYAYLAVHHVLKFHGAIPLSSKDLEAHTLNFKSIFDPTFVKKLLGEHPSPVGCGLARLGHFVACVKISERYILQGSKNVIFCMQLHF